MELSTNIVTKANEIADKHNFKLISIKFLEEQGEKILRVTLDKKGGITLNDITIFTEEFNLFLDEDTSINFAYQLDCTSPGAERFIEVNEIDDYLNEYMEVSYLDKKTTGTLIETNADEITLKYFIKGRIKKEVINKEDITKVQLQIKF